MISRSAKYVSHQYQYLGCSSMNRTQYAMLCSTKFLHYCKPSRVRSCLGTALILHSVNSTGSMRYQYVINAIAQRWTAFTTPFLTALLQKAYKKKVELLQFQLIQMEATGTFI